MALITACHLIAKGNPILREDWYFPNSIDATVKNFISAADPVYVQGHKNGTDLFSLPTRREVPSYAVP